MPPEIPELIAEISPYYKDKEKLEVEFNLNYDSTSETLEPVYFWIVDKMGELISAPEKLYDTFVSSPGSGHFSELMGKATHMQEQAMKIMQTNGILIKSIINIIYDLKEFEIRLVQYKKAKSSNKEESEAALLSLKQIWMDNVDVKRGAGSINMLSTGNLNFVTLRDAFMAVKDESLKDSQGNVLDLNDRVHRILKPRVQEFLQWKDISEKELTKRYEIEKVYLKNQLASLKMYTRWVQPYLKAANQLEQNTTSKNAGLVTAFNTIVLELAILSKKAVDFKGAAESKEIPVHLANVNFKRKYYSCVLVNFVFRGIPQKAGQHYVFGGRAEVNFRPYCLNQDEYDILKKRIDEGETADALKLASGMTDDTLKQLKEDLDKFLEDKKDKKEEAEKLDINPFSALFGKSDLEKEKKEKEYKDAE